MQTKHVFVHNNIFFSLGTNALDTVDDPAQVDSAYAAHNRDLAMLRELNEMGVDSVRFVLTTIVDYMGVRVVAQSIIPGILNVDRPCKVHQRSGGSNTIQLPHTTLTHSRPPHPLTAPRLCTAPRTKASRSSSTRRCTTSCALWQSA